MRGPEVGAVGDVHVFEVNSGGTDGLSSCSSQGCRRTMHDSLRRLAFLSGGLTHVLGVLSHRTMPHRGGVSRTLCDRADWDSHAGVAEEPDSCLKCLACFGHLRPVD